MKENKIEKLILDLSNRWDCSPQEAVDRLNSMNESEINKLIKDMVKKFQIGGRVFGPNIPYGNYRIINKETVTLPKKSGITQTQIDSVYNAEQEAFQKRASESIPELEQKIVDLRDKMGWDKSQRVKPIPGIKMPVTNSDPQYYNSPRQKFDNGGKAEQDPYRIKRHEFQSDTLNLTPGYRIISQRFYPIYEDVNTGKEIWYDFDDRRGRVLYDSPDGRKEVYYNTPDNYISYDHGYMPIGTTKDQESSKKWFYKFLDWVGPENREAQQLKKEEGLYKNGGIIDCLRAGGNLTECKKCGGKTLKAEDGNKIRRTDRPGYAWTLPNGIDVLTQDAVGIQPLPGSNSTIEGSSPEFETHRTTLTDKGGSPIAYNYNVYVNDGDHLFPSLRYTTDRIWHKPSTWFRRVLTPDAAAKKQAAYDTNNLKCGGSLPKKK